MDYCLFRAAVRAEGARRCIFALVAIRTERQSVARTVLFLASDDAAMFTANSYMGEAGSI